MMLTRKAEPQAKRLLQFEQIGGGNTAQASRHVGSVEGKQPSLDRAGKEKSRFLPFVQHKFSKLKILGLGRERKQQQINGRMWNTDDDRRTFFLCRTGRRRVRWRERRPPAHSLSYSASAEFVQILVKTGKDARKVPSLSCVPSSGESGITTSRGVLTGSAMGSSRTTCVPS